MSGLRQRIVLGILLAAAVIGLLYRFNLMPGSQRQESAVPSSFQLPSVSDTPATAAPVAEAVGMPTTQPAATKQPVIRTNIWAWNAQMGLLFANGGPITTKGSLMEKHGITVQLIRQDDTEKSKAELARLASALASGNANPADGIHFMIVMGDGAAAHIAGVNKLLDKLGSDYRAEIVGAVGYSRGEDGWWGPQAWKDNPEAMKGGTTAGVLRDGDWNITLYKLANDGIKNNPDATTWDPDAMNWFAADDYLKAVQMYVEGYCEDRPVVRNGRVTNEPKHKTCVDGYTTWTPGDVNGAKAKGGLVRLLSTAENIYQMPAVVIGIHRWNVTHAKQVQEFLAAALEGGDQVKSYPAALTRASQAAYAVYAEQSPGYWAKYYKGTTERDKTQQPVPLGGSTVMNLADNLLLFGISEGSGGLDNSVFKASYEGFGNIAKTQYPTLLPSFPKTSEAVNTTFLSALAAASPSLAKAEEPTFDEAGPIAKENVVAQRNWNITFDTGKATFTPEAESTLTELYNQLVVGAALSVEIDGHTDNVGNPIANKTLSEQRAFAVKQWLEAKAPNLFPENRVSVRAFGDTAPLAPNTTPEGRARNRRVAIILGTR
jgi:OmpA-OmpF porin, OOP family